MMTILEFKKTLTPAQQVKAAECATAEELLKLAQQERFSLTAEQAEEAIRFLHPPVGELSDDELEAVSGGGCGSGVCEETERHKLMSSTKMCPNCGSTGDIRMRDIEENAYESIWIEFCPNCGFFEKVSSHGDSSNIYVTNYYITDRGVREKYKTNATGL